MIDVYVDENGVLLNKLEIKDGDKLALAETDIVSAKAICVDENCKGNFDVEHLEELHKYLFGDIYDWAGQIRTVPMWKEEEAFGYMDSVRYATPDCIADDLKKSFQFYNNLKWDSLKYETKQEYLIDFLAEIWKIHPFREGNTRTCVTFACLYGEYIGIHMDRTLFAENPRFMRNALVVASDDPRYADKTRLEKIMKDSMSRGMQKFLEANEKNPYAWKEKEQTKAEKEIDSVHRETKDKNNSRERG